MTSGAQTKVIACCLCQCLVCNGRTTTSAARPRAGDPCEVSSILEKHTVAPRMIKPDAIRHCARRWPLWARTRSRIGGSIYWRRIASVLDFAPVRSEFDQKRIVDNESVLVLGL